MTSVKVTLVTGLQHFKLKFSESRTLADVLSEFLRTHDVSAALGVTPEALVVPHKWKLIYDSRPKERIPMTVPFKLSGVPANSQLRVVPAEVSKVAEMKRAAAEISGVPVAVLTPEGLRSEALVHPACSLWVVLSKFEKKEGWNLLKRESEVGEALQPVVTIQLNRIDDVRSLKTSTLKSLGFSKSAVLLRLTYSFTGLSREEFDKLIDDLDKELESVLPPEPTESKVEPSTAIPAFSLEPSTDGDAIITDAPLSEPIPDSISSETGISDDAPPELIPSSSMEVDSIGGTGVVRFEEPPVEVPDISMDDVKVSDFEIADSKLNFGRVERVLYNLEKEMNFLKDVSVDSKVAVLNLLSTITKKIMKAPEDPKFRTIDTGSTVLKERLGLFFETSLNYLLAIGFESRDSKLFLEESFVDIEFLQRAVKLLSKNSKRIQASKPPEESKLLFEEPEPLPTPREALIIFKESLESVSETAKKVSELPDTLPGDLELLKVAAKQERIKAEFASKLVSKSYIRSQLEKTKPKFDRTKIRFKFGDKFVVQTIFSASTTCREVISFFKSEVLEDSATKFILKVHPGTIVEADEKTVKEAGFVPGASMLVYDVETGRLHFGEGVIKAELLVAIIEDPTPKIEIPIPEPKPDEDKSKPGPKSGSGKGGGSAALRKLVKL